MDAGTEPRTTFLVLAAMLILAAADIALAPEGGLLPVPRPDDLPPRLVRPSTALAQAGASATTSPSLPTAYFLEQRAGMTGEVGCGEGCVGGDSYVQRGSRNWPGLGATIVRNRGAITVLLLRLVTVDAR